MNIQEAYESYINGNISIFKEWLNREATKRQIAHITYLWLRDKNDFLRLKAYIEEA